MPSTREIKMYHYVYILRSLKDKKFYPGCTNNLIRRFEEHNIGQIQSTRNRIRFILISWEGCLNKNDAIIREKYLKTAWGKRYVKNRIKNYLTG